MAFTRALERACAPLSAVAVATGLHNLRELGTRSPDSPLNLRDRQLRGGAGTNVWQPFVALLCHRNQDLSALRIARSGEREPEQDPSVGISDGPRGQLPRGLDRGRRAGVGKALQREVRVPVGQ